MSFLDQTDNRRYHYWLAVGLPLMVTVLTWFLHGYISAANITLIYILAVIFTAVNTATRPALVAALTSFLAFNMTFTEPRGSLLVIHRQDLLTAGLFLFTAILVGQLAARVKEHLELLQGRERFSRIELEFLEQLTTAIEPGQITGALTHAVSRLPGLKIETVAFSANTPQLQALSGPAPPGLQAWLDRPLRIDPSDSDTLYWQSGRDLFTVFHDGEQALGGLLVSNISASTEPWIRLLVNQASLALARTRLVEDLEKERIDKENELIRSSLLSSVSHDFRTPLTSMVGATSTLLELNDQLSTAQKKELLESILTEARRLNSYTQKLLDMTRLGRGELQLNRTTVTIDEILNVVIKRIRQHFPEQPVDASIDADLPAIDVHAALLEQAFYNVLENACKFSPPDRPVRITCRSDTGNMIVDIEDAGPGVPDAEKLKVFEMLHSADRGDCRAAGTGLGLAISKGMIGAHGGSVAMHDSAELGGCLVRITLPLSASHQERKVL